MQSSRVWQKFAMLAIVGLWASSMVDRSRADPGQITGGDSIDTGARAPANATFGINFEGADDSTGRNLYLVHRDPNGEPHSIEHFIVMNDIGCHPHLPRFNVR